MLIVAHASSLEACTRQLQGRSPLSPKDFIQIVRKVRAVTSSIWLGDAAKRQMFPPGLIFAEQPSFSLCLGLRFRTWVSAPARSRATRACGSWGTLPSSP